MRGRAARPAPWHAYRMVGAWRCAHSPNRRTADTCCGAGALSPYSKYMCLAGTFRNQLCRSRGTAGITLHRHQASTLIGARELSSSSSQQHESSTLMADINPNAEVLNSRAMTMLFTTIREKKTSQRDVSALTVHPFTSEHVHCAHVLGSRLTRARRACAVRASFGPADVDAGGGRAGSLVRRR